MPETNKLFCQGSAGTSSVAAVAAPAALPAAPAATVVAMPAADPVVPASHPTQHRFGKRVVTRVGQHADSCRHSKPKTIAKHHLTMYCGMTHNDGEEQAPRVRPRPRLQHSQLKLPPWRKILAEDSRRSSTKRNHNHHHACTQDHCTLHGAALPEPRHVLASNHVTNRGVKANVVSRQSSELAL